ncbi:DUF6087 family protein [Streptomyces aureus]|uniref:DUF6087 family protein n=1 Tax=Streptomyces aureus TaxID=193461 RepID=UPI0020B11D14|nr:DUF6087 family protein [Streptomyces aureus]
MNAEDPLDTYDKRRRPPPDDCHRHRPFPGCGGHLRPDEPRVLEQRDGFTYVPAGTAPDLATAQACANEAGPDAVCGEWTVPVRFQWNR